MRRDVFQAIADPTRREIIGLLAVKEMNLNSIAENFDISRPAISKHLRILHECGLVVVRKEGRERICRAELKEFARVSGWLEQYRKFWPARLDALGTFLEGESNGNIKNKRTKI